MRTGYDSRPREGNFGHDAGPICTKKRCCKDGRTEPEVVIVFLYIFISVLCRDTSTIGGYKGNGTSQVGDESERLNLDRFLYIIIAMVQEME